MNKKVMILKHKLGYMLQKYHVFIFAFFNISYNAISMYKLCLFNVYT